MRVGLATIVAGRRKHLRRQVYALRGIDVARYVVVAMDDAPVEVDASAVGAATVVERVAAGPGGLPLAAARNRALASLEDCELAILLDVDCIPGAQLVAAYRAGATACAAAPALLCGPVGYLDALPDAAPGPTDAQRRVARGRVIRDFPADGVARAPRPELFWSLSFAVSPALHRRLGGFDEGYVGYGAEDTDYGLRAAAAGTALWFVGGAWAYHQRHPPSAPARLAEVVVNARRFHARWGSWPMPDVLARAARDGAIRWEPSTGVCELAGRT